MLDLFSEYRRLIASVHVLTYEREGNIFRSKIQIEFIDKSILFIKEYVFANNERKYAYHWADHAGNLICRWDNASHWPNLYSFPHHKHIGKDIFESTEISIDDVLRVICDKLDHATNSSQE